MRLRRPEQGAAPAEIENGGPSPSLPAEEAAESACGPAVIGHRIAVGHGPKRQSRCPPPWATAAQASRVRHGSRLDAQGGRGRFQPEGAAAAERGRPRQTMRRAPQQPHPTTGLIASAEQTARQQRHQQGWESHRTEPSPAPVLPTSGSAAPGTGCRRFQGKASSRGRSAGAPAEWAHHHGGQKATASPAASRRKPTGHAEWACAGCANRLSSPPSPYPRGAKGSSISSQR